MPFENELLKQRLSDFVGKLETDKRTSVARHNLSWHC